mmetsp:Transcript_65965/g.59243  ORF Transcript_65965/g.59243 Transcript_65965/m.59243 type:complete len:193 (-) Transcript_65965:63-641(-)
MALARTGQLMARTFVNASRSQLPSAMHLSRRLKTYLVGVDGSGYGFSALKTVCSGANNGDEVICMYFPPNLELMMVQPESAQTISKEIYDAQHEHTMQIESKCKEIIQKHTSDDSDITFEMHIGEHSFSPQDDLVEECYKTKADVLVVGSKGISHSMKEKITDTINRTGAVTDWVVRHAPCDVLVVKVEHEY